MTDEELAFEASRMVPKQAKWRMISKEEYQRRTEPRKQDTDVPAVLPQSANTARLRTEATRAEARRFTKEVLTEAGVLPPAVHTKPRRTRKRRQQQRKTHQLSVAQIEHRRLQATKNREKDANDAMKSAKRHVFVATAHRALGKLL